MPFIRNEDAVGAQSAQCSIEAKRDNAAVNPRPTRRPRSDAMYGVGRGFIAPYRIYQSHRNRAAPPVNASNTTVSFTLEPLR